MENRKQMKVIELRNGVQMPLLGFGTSTTTNNEILKDKRRIIDSIKYALTIGYRHIDTAEYYQNENLVATAIQVSFISIDYNYLQHFQMPKKIIQANSNNLKIFS